MTLDEYDNLAKTLLWVPYGTRGACVMWTGWKRRFHNAMAYDLTVPTDPVDDSLAGQWVADCGRCWIVQTSEINPDITIHSSKEIMEDCRRGAFDRIQDILNGSADLEDDWMHRVPSRRHIRTSLA